MLGDSLRRRHKPGDGTPERPAPPRAGKRRFGVLRWLIAAVVMLLGSFLTGYLISTQVLFPRPETAGTGIAVPALYGVERSEAEQQLEAAGLVVGEVTELVGPDADAGTVLAQDPVPGQQLRRGAAVSLAVSSGGPQARIPSLAGLDAVAAQSLLQQAGLQVDVQQVRSVEVRKGAVIGTEPASGSIVRRPAVIRMVVSAGPPVLDSLAPMEDTLPPAPPSTDG